MKGPPTVLLHKSFRIEFESSSNRVRIELGAPTAYKLEEKSRENFFARIRRGPTLCCCCVSVLKPKKIFFGCPISRKNTVKKYCCNFFREMVWQYIKANRYYLFFFIYTLYRVFHQEIHNQERLHTQHILRPVLNITSFKNKTKNIKTEK